MVPNKVFHNLKKMLKDATQHIPCPTCTQIFQTRAGQTKHLHASHPSIEDTAHYDISSPICDKPGPSAFAEPTSDIPPLPTSLPSWVPPSPNQCSTNQEFTWYVDDQAGNPMQIDDETGPLYQFHDTPLHSPSPVAPKSEGLEYMDVNLESDCKNSNFSSSSTDTPISIGSCLPCDSPEPRHQAHQKEHYTWTYHPKLNGKQQLYLLTLVQSNNKLSTGIICDKDRNDLLPNSPPPPPNTHPHHNHNDWFPYDSQVQFELADSLFWHNQMSEGDTDFLLNHINGLQAAHGKQVPFCNHSHMHNVIDVTTLGEAPWDHFTFNYNSPLPDNTAWKDEPPSWMTEEHEIWFHDPVTLLENLLANLDFKDKFN